MSSHDDIAAPGWTSRTRIDLWERLHDGTGHTPHQLQRLLWDLVSMPEPARGLTWLRNSPTAGDYLRGLARGDIPLTHDALHGLPSWRTAAHLRDLLMASGALPCIDRQILLFERWYRNQLQAVSDPAHEQLLRQFATWHLLPRMRAKPSASPSPQDPATPPPTSLRWPGSSSPGWPARAASHGRPPRPTSTPGSPPGRSRRHWPGSWTGP